MKFSSPVRAPEGLNSYAKVNRVRPVHTAITVFEALLSLFGVAILILGIHYHSFARAGLILDQALHCAWMHIAKLIHHS